MATHNIDISGNTAEAGSTQINNVTFTTVTTNDIDRLCLHALQCPDSLKVKNQLKINKDKLLYESIDWIFHSPEFIHWRDGDDISLLWIKGGAGKGKTMMSIGLIERLPSNKDVYSLATYFFYQNADYQLNTLEAMIKGLILRLIIQQPDLKEHLRRRWDTKNERFEEDMTAWQTSLHVFLEMLENCKCQRVYIIVDALDECEGNGMADFLSYIIRTGLDSASKIKWLLTSRPLGHSERELLTGAEQIGISLDLNSTHIAQGIMMYIGSKITQLDPNHSYGESLRQNLALELIKRSEDTYLWVSLVCKELDSEPRDRVMATVRNFPPGLHSLYHSMMHRLIKGETAEVKYCLRLLKASLVAYRPLAAEEIGSLTGLLSEEPTIKTMVDRCSSFVQMRGTIIEFVHKSAKDYLAGEDGQFLINSHESFGHGEVCLNCISYLSERLKVNLVQLPRPSSTNEEVLNDKNKSALLVSMDYAATFWAQHLERTKSTPAIDEAIGTFLGTKLLEWLECLSLLEKLPHAIKAFKTLMSKANQQPESEIRILAEDALGFLRRHYAVLVQWPLQVYSSALVLSPQSSVIRDQNLSKIPSWIRNASCGEFTWPPVVETLIGHTKDVTAVAFSPNGSQIVSSSKDNTVRLWDSTTGNFSKTLAGHSGAVNAVSFSPDGNQIVSASDDTTIRLWGATTGNLLTMLTGHKGDVYTAVYSQDGKQIFSASEDKTIRIWDATKGHVQKTVKNHQKFDKSYLMSSFMAFSPDCKHIVTSPDGDQTIRMQDVTTGDLYKTFKSDEGIFDPVAFSRNGEQLATRCNLKDINLWNITTEKVQMTLKSHSSYCITAIAFSTKSNQIVSGDDGGIINIWDTVTGSLLKTMTCYQPGITTLAFSPSDKYIISGFESGSIKLWDATSKDSPKAQVVDHPISAIVVSPDSKQIVSGSRDGTIKFLDATTGYCQKTVRGHNDYINGMVFSPDGKTIASASEDATIKLWDALTGNCQMTLKEAGRSLAVPIAFSIDGKLIASSTYKLIRLWNTATGDLQQILKGHSRSVLTISFSPDNKIIASGSADGAIRLWDITTGSHLKTLTSHPSMIRLIAFSSKGDYLASGCYDWTIQLWDVARCLKRSGLFGSHLKFKSCLNIEPRGPVQNLKFLSDDAFLAADHFYGRLKNRAMVPGLLDLWVMNGWVYYGLSPVLRLPMDFMPVRFDVRGDTVAIGCQYGRMLSFDIDRSSLHAAIEPLADDDDVVSIYIDPDQ